VKGVNTMAEYKPNSHKSKSVPEKKVEKVIAGTVKSKKKNEIQKFAGLFLPEDVSNVKSYILFDVIVPLIKRALSDTVEAILYPEGRPGKNSTASKISYRSYYDKSNERNKDYNTSRPRTGYSYDDIILDNRGEVEDVLSRMDELISTYGLVSVADLYDLVGVTGNYTDNKYGWTDIRSASVIRVRDGYMLKLPKVLPLN
jgi:hypothetical protein